jgi:hypothetical protein
MSSGNGRMPSGGIWEHGNLIMHCFPIIYCVDVPDEDSNEELLPTEVGQKRSRDRSYIDGPGYKRARLGFSRRCDELSDPVASSRHRGVATLGSETDAAVDMGAAFSVARDENEREIHFAATQHAIDQWKARQHCVSALPNLPEYHKCSSANCKYSQLTVEVWDTRDSRYTHSILLRSGAVVNNIHICVSDVNQRIKYCDFPHDRAVHYRKRWVFQHLFLCELSYSAHLCGSYCDKGDTSISTDRVETCPITGLTDVEARALHDKQSYAIQSVSRKHNVGQRGYLTARGSSVGRTRNDQPPMAVSIAEVRDEWCSRVIGSKTVEGVLKAISELQSTLDCHYREIYYCIAVGYVWMFFCDERLQYELRREADGLQKMNVLVHIYCNQNRNRDGGVREQRNGRTRERKRSTSSLMDLVAMLYGLLSKHARNPVLEYHVAPDFVKSVAHQIVKLWYTIKTNVTRSELKKMYLFPDFVWPAMTVLAKGLYLPSDSIDLPDVAVIERNRALDMIQPITNLDSGRSAPFFEGMRHMCRAIQHKKVVDVIVQIVHRTRNNTLFAFDNINYERMAEAEFMPIANIRTSYAEMARERLKCVKNWGMSGL